MFKNNTILRLVATMTTHFGKLENFQPETEALVSYFEQVDLFFVVNDIADSKEALLCIVHDDVMFNSS